MSSLNFSCPAPAALTAITKPSCPTKFGQIQRLGIRMIPSAADAIFAPSTGEVDIVTRTKWTGGIAAVDSTKIILTPFISGLVIPPGALIKEEGGNNNTINGISIIQGLGNIVVTGKFYNLELNIADQLKALTIHTALTPGFTNLEVFFFNEFGHILCKRRVTAVGPPIVYQPYGVKIYNWNLSSVGSEGLLKSNIHTVEFELAGDWDANLWVYKPVELVSNAWSPLDLWPA